MLDKILLRLWERLDTSQWHFENAYSAHAAESVKRQPLPPLKTASDYAQEAREGPFILRPFSKDEWGGRNPENKQFINDQYARVREWTGYSAWFKFTLLWSVPVLFGLPLGTAVGLYYQSIALRLEDPLPFWLPGILVAAVGLGLGIPVVLFGTMRVKFGVAFARVVLFEQRASVRDRLQGILERLDALMSGQSIENEHRNKVRFSLISGWVNMYAPRLAFIDLLHRGPYFAGPKGKSGFRKAAIHLQIPAGTRIYELDDCREIYNFYPRRHTFTGNAAQSVYLYIQSLASIGTRLYNESTKNRLEKFLKDNFLWLILIAEIIAIVYIVENAGTYTYNLLELAREAQGG